MGISFPYMYLDFKKPIKINVLASINLSIAFEKNIGTKCKILKKCTSNNHLSLFKISKYHMLRPELL